MKSKVLMVAFLSCWMLGLVGCCHRFDGKNPAVPRLFFYRSLASGPVGGVLPRNPPENYNGGAMSRAAVTCVVVTSPAHGTKWRPFVATATPPSNANLLSPGTVFTFDSRKKYKAKFKVNPPASIPSIVNLDLKPNKKTTLEVSFH